MAVGVVVVVLATVFFVAWLKDAPVRRMIGFLEKDVQSDRKYVEEMAGHKQTLDQLLDKRKDDRNIQDFNNEFKGKVRLVPVVFSNEFDRALMRNDVPTASNLLAEWNASETSLLILGLPRRNLRVWMQEQLRKVEVKAKEDELRRKVQDLIHLAERGSVQKDLAELLDGYSKIVSDPALNETDGKNLRDSVVRCYRRMAGGMSEKNDLTALDSLIALVEKYGFKDTELQSMKKKVSDSLAIVKTEQERIQREIRDKVSKAISAFDTLKQRAEQATASPSELGSVAYDLAKTNGALRADILKDPAVAQAYVDAVSSCRKSATSLISRRDDTVGRAVRLEAMSRLLDDKTIQGILEDSNKSMTKALNLERRVFVVKVSNTSGKNVLMRVEAGQVSTKISADQKNLLVPFPATGERAKKVVIFETDESGYVAQTSTVDIVGGGGAELTVESFKPATVAVSLTLPGRGTARSDLLPEIRGDAMERLAFEFGNAASGRI